MYLKLVVAVTLMFVSFLTRADKIQVVTEHLEPYQIVNEDGSIGGFMTEVVRAMFEITGDTPEISALPWPRAFKIASSQKNVMIYSIVKTASREKNFYWIGNVKSQPLYLWGLTDKNWDKTKTIASYKEFRIATGRASNVANYLNNNGFKYVVELPSEDKFLPMLQRNRVDFIGGSFHSMQRRIDKSDMTMAQIERLIEVKNINMKLSVAFNIESDKTLVERFSKAFATLEQSGKLKQIRDKWYKK